MLFIIFIIFFNYRKWIEINFDWIEPVLTNQHYRVKSDEFNWIHVENELSLIIIFQEKST